MRVLLVLAFFLSAFSQASVKMDVGFVPEGSAKPPGDVLNVRVYALGEAEPFQLEVSALLVSGVRNEKATPVKTNSKTLRDGSGRFKMVVPNVRPVVRGDSGMATADFRFVAPFVDLALPRGENLKLGYVVTALRRDNTGEVLEVLAAVPTTIYPVSVTDDIRREMKMPPPELKYIDKKVAAVTMVDGNLVSPGKVNVKEVVEVPPGPQLMATVSIPGEFKRDPKVTPVEATTPKPQGQMMVMGGDIVQFATNRNLLLKAGETTFGSGFSPQLIYGEARVHIPSAHQLGKIEEVGWWDKEKGFYIQNISRDGSSAEFYARIKESNPGDTLLFIHGYRNTFEDAILHTAQIAKDTDFKGNAMAFTWPSYGSLDKYAADEANAENSAGASREILKELVEHHQKNGGNLFVIAHSMGNRVLLMGLRDLYKSNPELAANSPIKVLALAAPDVDIHKFLAWGTFAEKFADLMPFYYSSKDWALYGSEKKHTMNRAGLYPAFISGMDTISADQANTVFLGHTYFSACDQVILDLQLQIEKFQKPGARVPPLEFDKATSDDFGFDHWQIIPAKK